MFSSRFNQATQMIHPFKNKQGGPYGYAEPTDYGEPHHLGIDWYTNFENLVAPVKSRIISASYGPAGGYTLVFQPIGSTRLIRWLHLNKFFVKTGQIVEEGRLLCQSGNSGKRPGSNAPYRAHTHEDHWKSKVTLLFKDTLDPREFYKGAKMAQIKSQAKGASRRIVLEAADLTEWTVLAKVYGKDPNIPEETVT